MHLLASIRCIIMTLPFRVPTMLTYLFCILLPPSLLFVQPLLSARYGLWIVIWVVLIMIIHRILNFLHSQWIDNQFMTVLSVTLDMELDEKLDLVRIRL